MPKERKRCAWARNPLALAYHDREWGVPVRDDQILFEFLILEGAQAGLSWDTILAKRENYRKAFDRFDPSARAFLEVQDEFGTFSAYLWRFTDAGHVRLHAGGRPGERPQPGLLPPQGASTIAG